MFKRYAMACLIVVMLTITICACAAPVPQPTPEMKTLKVGSIMPFTGQAALWGLSLRPGMELYARLINEDGGLKVGEDRYQVEMHFIDAYGPAPAAAAARKLIYDHKVSAIVGYFGLGIAAISQVTNPEKVILNISTVGGIDPFPTDDSYVFYGYPVMELSIYQALSAMQAFPQYHTLGWTGLRSGDQTPETMFAPTDRKLLEEFGIKSVREYYPEGTMNFTPYLTKMAEKGVEVIYCVGTPLEIGLMAKQRYQMGYTWPICQAAPGLDLDLMKGIAGSEEALQNIVSDYPIPWELKKVTVTDKYKDMARRIWDTYKKESGKELWYGCFGGSAMNSMGQYFEILEQAGTTDPDAIMRTIRGGTFDSFMGRYTLSGKEYYGSDVVFGYHCAMGIVKGLETVYLGEYPMMNVDTPFAEF
ncbi:MAG: ABC transporter substrate-binding protein [Dehalococcoidia bacterium]|nr:ABC transporter substrate-binding protein [Dehalococcoidia bacterium]